MTDLDTPEAFFKKVSSRYKNRVDPLEASPIHVQGLLSPLTVKLPRTCYEKAEQAINSFFKLRENRSYQDKVLMTKPDLFESHRFSNSSVLMAYDFHMDETGKAELIEVNTNASGYLISLLLREDGLQAPLEDLLFDSFNQESQLALGKSLDHVLIVDENLSRQKMIPEFSLYKKFFRDRSVSCEVCDLADLKIDDNGLASKDGQKYSFIYNRHTDFDLSLPQSKELKRAYQQSNLCLSPQPQEYFLLAHKERLNEFSRGEHLDRLSDDEQSTLREVLLESRSLETYASLDEVWMLRKKLFFKPKQGFGGKMTYRGSSISRTAFEKLNPKETLAQKFSSPGKIKETRPSGEVENWKFDIRFFVYRNQIQHMIARVYQGQVTNFSTPGGGFAEVEF